MKCKTCGVGRNRQTAKYLGFRNWAGTVYHWYECACGTSFMLTCKLGVKK